MMYLTTASSVRAELVEALPFFSREEKNNPSTSSGRTVEGVGIDFDELSANGK
jgi:hypothetical protein